jgi:hypothetical protein
MTQLPEKFGLSAPSVKTAPARTKQTNRSELFIMTGPTLRVPQEFELFKETLFVRSSGQGKQIDETPNNADRGACDISPNS